MFKVRQLVNGRVKAIWLVVYITIPRYGFRSLLSYRLTAWPWAAVQPLSKSQSVHLILGIPISVGCHETICVIGGVFSQTHSKFGYKMQTSRPSWAGAAWITGLGPVAIKCPSSPNSPWSNSTIANQLSNDTASFLIGTDMLADPLCLPHLPEGLFAWNLD